MKKPFCFILLILCWIFGSFSAFAADEIIHATYPERPVNGEFISDYAGIVSPRDREEISKIAARLKAETGIKLTVITVNRLPMTAYYPRGRMRFISEPLYRNVSTNGYFRLLFDHWQGDSKPQANEVFLAIFKKNRKAGIWYTGTRGYMLEDQTKHIVKSSIIPLLRRGNYSYGILEGVEAIDILSRVETEALYSKDRILKNVICFILIYALLVFMSFANANKKLWRTYVKISFMIFLLFLFTYLVSMTNIMNDAEMFLSLVWYAVIVLLSVTGYSLYYAAQNGPKAGLRTFSLLLILLICGPFLVLAPFFLMYTERRSRLHPNDISERKLNTDWGVDW